MSILSTVKLKHKYEHIESGKHYTVTGFTNVATTDHVKFPQTVVYQELEVPYNTWSRPMSDFAIKFKKTW